MNARTDKAARSGAIDSGSADTGSISSGSINSGPINSEAATTRLSRLLTMVPWLMNRQGIDIEEAARTLGVSRAQIEADLELLFVCGTPCLLYTSDAADDTPCVDLGGRRIRCTR